MSQRKSLVLACLAFSALPLLVGVKVDTANAAGPFDSITQNWDKNLPSASRFTLLAEFNNEAVRDNETGLVWQKNVPTIGTFAWYGATHGCLGESIGGRQGWRLPSVHEFASLHVNAQNRLPAGHPFVGVDTTGAAFYWTATTADLGSASGNAWIVSFSVGTTSPHHRDKNTSVTGRQWCVRGGGPLDTY